MNEEHDEDEVSAWLRRGFEGPVADDGFVARVMHTLPPRPVRRAWVLPAAACAGALLAWLALLPSPLWPQLAHEWAAADFGGGSAVLLALLLGLGLLGGAWALEEGP